MLLLVFLAVFVLGIDAGGANFHTRFGSNLVCLYPFTDGQTTPGATTVADVSNSTFSPGSLVLGSTASWIPTSLGVRLAARAPGLIRGTGLTSTSTLSNWTLHMRAQQSIAPPTFTVELWIRSSNAVQTLARALVGFRDWTTTFATPGQETQSYGMKVEDNVNMNWYVTDVNSTGRLDTGGSFNATLRNSSSLLMVVLTHCARVNASVNFGDCYVNDAYMNVTTMAYCLTIRGGGGGGTNYTSCKTSAGTSSIRFANTIDFRAWSLANMLQFAPFYSSNVSNQPHSWAGDILLAAVYAQSLNGSMQAQNYAAGLPNSNPYVASTAQMSAFEDTMNASLLFAFTGYDFDEGDQLRFDVVQLPSVGTLYDYNGTHFLPITSVPYRITGAAPLAGYLQAPALTYGMNFTSFQFNAWDGQASSRTNCTVTVNVFNVNHVPHSFPSNQTVNAQVPTSINAFRCTDPDAPAGDYIAQYCVASAPEFGGTFTANQVPVASFPYCFSSNSTTFQLLYTSLAISANSTNVTDVFTFYCADTFGTHSNATRYYLYVQNSVWAVAGTSTGQENGNITVQLLGTSNITSNIQYHIVGLPAAGVLYNGNNTQISTVPVAVVNASGNYTLLFTASVTNGTTVTSVPTVHQLNVTPVNYDFTVARPAAVAGYVGVPTPAVIAISSYATPASLFFVQIVIDTTSLEQLSLNFTSGLNASRFASSGALGTYTCRSDFRGCSFWGTQAAANALLNGMTLSRFNEGTDNVFFVITSCLLSYCESSNYTQTFNITFTWTPAPPTTSSSSTLVLILVYAGIIGLPVLCCVCCFCCAYRRRAAAAAGTTRLCRLRRCCRQALGTEHEKVELVSHGETSTQ